MWKWLRKPPARDSRSQIIFTSFSGTAIFIHDLAEESNKSNSKSGGTSLTIVIIAFFMFCEAILKSRESKRKRKSKVLVRYCVFSKSYDSLFSKTAVSPPLAKYGHEKPCHKPALPAWKLYGANRPSRDHWNSSVAGVVLFAQSPGIFQRIKLQCVCCHDDRDALVILLHSNRKY